MNPQKIDTKFLDFSSPNKDTRCITPNKMFGFVGKPELVTSKFAGVGGILLKADTLGCAW
ncbi:hypothetical protein DLK05_06200 [Ancylomarina longa]|uniref:Uncharacterized protein n=1 Tax=Ancylomarina longa TaxID=2487017 RepID=A0A434AW48_9BACT|nr:hypothetical protein DLK05_06200 [Ancylomarina longa]